MSNRFTRPSSGITTRLTLLAMLSGRPKHGYDLRKELEERQMERWADLQYGSIYASLRQLTKEGLLQEVATERTGNRPARTLYQSTPAGKEELLHLLRRIWAQPTLSAQPLDVALSFYWLLPSEELVRLLENRLSALDAIVLDLEMTQAQAGHPDPGVQAMIADLFEHNRRLLALERAWTEHLLHRLSSGAYRLTTGVEPRTESEII
jgi:DNA-binding PadR family transcriptional regulator